MIQLKMIMLEIFLVFIIFFILSLVSFYIPGKLFIEALKLKEDSYATFLLSWISGTALFILVSFAFAYLKIPYLTIVLIILCLFLFYRKVHYAKESARKQMLDLFRSQDKTLWTIIILGSLSFVAITFFSGYQTPQYLQFTTINSINGVLHLASVKTQANVFPPQYPGLADVALHGYDYFYDFLLSRFVLFYNLAGEDLVFRLFPLYISLLYGGTLLLFSQKFTGDKTALRLILFLAYFAQSTTSVFLALNNEPDLLGSNQPLLLILDPSIVLGLSFLFIVLYSIPKIKEHVGYAMVTGLLLGILTQIQVYIGVTGILSFIISAVYLGFITNWKCIKNYLLAFVIAGIGTWLTYGITNFGPGSLVFAPLHFYEQYMQLDNFDSLQWETITTMYREQHNILAVIQMFVAAIGTFWLINLGLRLVIFLKSPGLLQKFFWTKPYTPLLFFTTLVTILIPSFYVQSSQAFDTVQFIWIALVLLCIPTGIVWATIINKSVSPLKLLILLVIVVFCLPGYWSVESLYIGRAPVYVIPKDEQQVFKKITKKVPKKSLLIVLPWEYKNQSQITLKYNIRPISAAMTGREIYYEGDMEPTIPASMIDERTKNIRRLVLSTVLCDPSLIKQSIKILGSNYIVTADPNQCLGSKNISRYKMESKTLSFYIVK